MPEKLRKKKCVISVLTHEDKSQIALLGASQREVTEDEIGEFCYGCLNLTESGECLVFPRIDGKEDGRSELVSDGICGFACLRIDSGEHSERVDCIKLNGETYILVPRR